MRSFWSRSESMERRRKSFLLATTHTGSRCRGGSEQKHRRNRTEAAQKPQGGQKDKQAYFTSRHPEAPQNANTELAEGMRKNQEPAKSATAAESGQPEAIRNAHRATRTPKNGKGANKGIFYLLAGKKPENSPRRAQRVCRASRSEAKA